MRTMNLGLIFCFVTIPVSVCWAFGTKGSGQKGDPCVIDNDCEHIFYCRAQQVCADAVLCESEQDCPGDESCVNIQHMQGNNTFCIFNLTKAMQIKADNVQSKMEQKCEESMGELVKEVSDNMTQECEQAKEVVREDTLQAAEEVCQNITAQKVKHAVDVTSETCNEDKLTAVETAETNIKEKCSKTLKRVLVAKNRECNMMVKHVSAVKVNKTITKVVHMCLDHIEAIQGSNKQVVEKNSTCDQKIRETVAEEMKNANATCEAKIFRAVQDTVFEQKNLCINEILDEVELAEVDAEKKCKSEKAELKAQMKKKMKKICNEKHINESYQEGYDNGYDECVYWKDMELYFTLKQSNETCENKVENVIKECNENMRNASYVIGNIFVQTKQELKQKCESEKSNLEMELNEQATEKCDAEKKELDDNVTADMVEKCNYHCDLELEQAALEGKKNCALKLSNQYERVNKLCNESVEIKVEATKLEQKKVCEEEKSELVEDTLEQEEEKCGEKIKDAVVEANKDRPPVVTSNADAQLLAQQKAYDMCLKRPGRFFSSDSKSCFYKLSLTDTFYNHVKACEADGAILAYPETQPEFKLFERLYLSGGGYARTDISVGFVTYQNCEFISLDGKVLLSKRSIWWSHIGNACARYAQSNTVVSYGHNSLILLPANPAAKTRAMCKVHAPNSRV